MFLFLFVMALDVVIDRSRPFVLFVLIDSLVNASARVTIIAGIASATFKLVNNRLLVDNRGFSLFVFEFVSNFSRDKHWHYVDVNLIADIF